MAPLRWSRHSFVAGVRTVDGQVALADRQRYAYRAWSDNRVHVVVEGETLWALAGRYFAPLPRACGLWWIIADYQPDPIHDPTITLTAGTKLVIPSVRTVTQEIFSARRTAEATA